MVTAVLITSIWAFAIAVAVVWANPRRFSNRALAFLCCLCAGWSGCVYVGLRCEAVGAYTAAAHWFIADNILTAFLALANWLLKEALLAPPHSERQILRRSAPWLGVAIVLTALSLTPNFITAPGATHTQLQRGEPYFAYVLIELGAHLVILFQAILQLRKATGVRRIEIQFVILNVSVSSFLSGALNGIGSYLHVVEIKQAGFPLVICMLVIMAWAMVVHRVLDVRQVFTSIAQRVMVVAVAATLAWFLQTVLERTDAPLSEIISMATGIAVGLVLDRQSRKWMGLDGGKQLEWMRQQVINLSRTEPGTDTLIAALEAFLRSVCQVKFVQLASETGSTNVLRDAEPRAPDYRAVFHLGWGTPESLQRRRISPGLLELQRFMREKDLGLILVIPRGTPTPSLVVLLGTKTNGNVFTWAEVERLINVAELMDNILARSRLTTQAALQAKTEHLALMSRGLAHDLKNLITPISSFLVHTDRPFPAGSAEGEVHDAAKRSVRLINDYITEALFFANRLTPRFEHVGVASVLDSVRHATAGRVKSRGIRLEITQPGNLVLNADKVLLQRMLVNLVANAVDASPRGGRVDLSVERVDDSDVRFRVADHGCGIPDANLKQVFDPYFTTKEFGDDVRGFGLGLTICQKIVALHDGTISIQSRPGAGTTVTIELPVDRVTAPPTVPADVAIATSRRAD